MIISVDIGNSTIGFGFLEQGRLERIVKIEHEPESVLVQTKIDNFLQHIASRHTVEKVVICSVVPKALRCEVLRIRRILGLRPLIIGRDIKIPILNKYKNPRLVGTDRLLCAYAAREIYGSPTMVIDLGTAITFDAVSVSGDYLGGAIIPGLHLSANVLFEKTALLPKVKLVAPQKVIGRSTVESIQSGLFHGYGALCDGMVVRFAKEMNCCPGVVMTGGYAGQMQAFMLSPVTAVDEGLIFKGMALLV